MTTRTLGIIGGSGLYQFPGLADVSKHVVETPFGAPSDTIVAGTLGETRVYFLPRHGQGHRFPPHRVNYRANVFALKALGVEQLLSVSAVGSLKESIRPGDMVIVDQFIDCTKRRDATFFDEPGCVAHVGFGDPVDRSLASALYRSATSVGARSHNGGTYVCIEGPQFSSRAESNLYRSWGADVIGMTAMPEAKLAREAELPYANLSLATDYDCWHVETEDVTATAVFEVVKQNAETAQRIVKALVASLPDPAQAPASKALETAFLTPPRQVAEEVKVRLKPLFAKYL